MCLDDLNELLDLFSAYLCGIIGSAVSLEVQEEVNCRLSFSWPIFVSFLNTLNSSKISALPLLQSRSSSESVPKITTHYSIVPRESDARWKGILTKTW